MAEVERWAEPRKYPDGYEVYHLPCVDCRHHKRLHDGSICSKLLMAVTRCMHVTYKPGQLCFEPIQPETVDAQ